MIRRLSLSLSEMVWYLEMDGILFAHFFWVSFAALWSERLIASVFFSASVNFHFRNVWYHAFLCMSFLHVFSTGSCT